MSKEFEIVCEGEFPGTPEQVWDAVTTETAAWLFPTDGMPGEDIVSERPTHHVNRMEGADGWFNQLEQVIEDRPEGRSFLRWVHSGVFAEDWDTQYDGASAHTAFYLHTLAEYLEHFVGRPVVFASVDGPTASADPGAFGRVKAALGLGAGAGAAAGAGAGDSVPAALPGIASETAVVDFWNDNFVGIRTGDALYRFFGRNAFGAPVGVTVHHFGAADPTALQNSWQDWLDRIFD
ncbi:SRPBCC domain-containing protein [Cryobacterium mannosilyticum]